MKMLLRPNWRKIGIVAAAAAVVVAALVVLLPRVIDVEAYKPGLIEAVREATGRELVIDGPMKLTMFPVPGIGAGTVHFSNAVGAIGAQMLDVRWVAVKPSWWGLLRGRIEVGTLTLYAPTIVLETDAEGHPNWGVRAGWRRPAGCRRSEHRLPLGDGSGRDCPRRHHLHRSADQEVHLGDRRQRWRLGRIVRRPVPDRRQGHRERRAARARRVGRRRHRRRHQTKVSLRVSSGELAFKGSVGAIALDTKLKGHLSVKTGGLLSDFVSSVLSATGAPKPAFDTSGAGRFSFEGDIDIAPDRIAATDFNVAMGKDDAKGTLSLALGDTISLDGNVSLSRLDVGNWLEILARPIDFTPDPEPVKTVTNAPTPQAAAAKAANAVMARSPWSRVSANVTVAIAEALYNNETMRDFSAALDMKKGVVVVPRLKASLPGGLSIDVDAAKGPVRPVGQPSPRHAEMAGVDTSGVPSGKLETLTAQGTLAAKAGGLDLSGGTFRLDGVAGTVGGTLLLKIPVAATLDIAMDQFDLDAYMPKPSNTPSPAAPPPSPATKVASDAPSLGLKLNIGKLVYRRQTLASVAGGATLQGNVLKLDDVKVANLLGASSASRATCRISARCRASISRST